MQTSFPELKVLTLVITTALILVFVIAIIYIVLFHQRKQYRSLEEVLNIKEEFTKILLSSEIEIQEQTLNHISKELHANVSPLVFLMNINLAEIIAQSSGEPNETLLETKLLGKQIYSELKDLSVKLNTDHIKNIGFRKAIENELVRISKARKCIGDLIISGEENNLCPEHEIILFRLCQEVLNNIVKYARASKVTVRIDNTADQMKVSIIDNGIGFDIHLAKQQSAERESTGLINIAKRAQSINAEFQIKSQVGQGTRIDICIPNKKLNQ